MIRIEINGRYLELRNCYEWRDEIKALADSPDVRWNGERRCWQVDARLWDKLAAHLGAHFAPVTYDLIRALPCDAPAATHRKRTQREIMAQKAADQRAARKAGRAIVEMGRL